jgi:HD-GYP domain-containing protein (c-di-GMP phosphodiesterase class II)
MSPREQARTRFVSVTITRKEGENMILISTRSFAFLMVLALVGALVGACYVTKYFNEKIMSIKLLEILVGIIEAGNHNLDGHSLHVHNLVMVMYMFLPYSLKIRVRQKDLHYATLLLDIGKLGIPREILERAGKLEGEEWELIRKHPDIGVEILEDIPGFSRVKEYIKYHHERIDGKGYHQLTGDQIPLGAKMIAVADAYSAMTMNRSYKAHLPYAEATSELRMAAGTQLDDELVKIFCSIPMSKVDACLEDVRMKMGKYNYERKGK